MHFVKPSDNNAVYYSIMLDNFTNMHNAWQSASNHANNLEKCYLIKDQY